MYWVSVAEARDMLGIDKNELERLIRAGRLETIKRGGKRLVRTETVKAAYRGGQCGKDQSAIQP